MAENTAIEWADDTFNPWIGCDKIAPECTNCYAATLNAKRGHWVEEWKAGVPRHRTAASTWKDPQKWNREANSWDRQRRVFGGSLCDWLDEEVSIEWLADYLRLIFSTPNLDWLLLTKRITNFYERLVKAADYLHKNSKNADDAALREAIIDWTLKVKPPANVHLGMTLGSKKLMVDLDFFKRVPARVHFLSIEPLLENIVAFNARGDFYNDLSKAQTDTCYFDFDGIDGVIVGGESGDRDQKIRPMHPYWVDRILMAVALYNARPHHVESGRRVKFFYKQQGDWIAYSQSIALNIMPAPNDEHCWLDFNGRQYPYDSPERPKDDAIHMVRLGKKRAGRLWKGKEYNDLPVGIRKEAAVCQN